MSGKRSTKINYKIFHETGEKIEINDISKRLEGITLDGEIMVNLQIDLEALIEDVHDLIEENPINEFNVLAIQDIDSNIEKIHDLRSSIRKIFKEFEKHPSYDCKFQLCYDKTLSLIKDYIKDGNDMRHKLRMKDFVKEQENKASEEKQYTFMMNDVSRMINGIYADINVKLNDLEDETLLQRKEALFKASERLDCISSKIGDLLKYKVGEIEVTEVTKRYDNLLKDFAEYNAGLITEIEIREISKEKLFKESKLNIKLDKFKNYDSLTDIYTFKSNFEKIYAKTTPSRLMPDLLKNNFLDEPALSLVKSIDDIAEIWNRLIKAYGEPKIMLSKKIELLRTVDTIWKSKDSEKISDALARIISIIRDLMKLSERHNIEGRLYNSDAIDRIYKILGDSRVTRWLTSICDVTLDDRELWVRLLGFSEKELKVQ